MARKVGPAEKLGGGVLADGEFGVFQELLFFIFFIYYSHFVILVYCVPPPRPPSLRPPRSCLECVYDR